jgi:hypothetical protein
VHEPADPVLADLVRRGVAVTPFVPIAMYGWWLVVAGAVVGLRPGRAALFLGLFGWMFLPIASIKLEGLPNYDKPNIVALGLFVTILVAGRAAWRGLRWNWTDTAVLVLCLSPGASALSVGTGTYDAISAVAYRTLFWGCAYVAGRVMLGDRDGIRDICWAILIAGLVYAPFCLWEVRMSPQLHNTLYGYQQHTFAQTMRGGGFRPQVFMNHGLAVAIFMVSASIAGISIWRFGKVRSWFGIDLAWLVLALVVTTILTKSTGALMLLAIVLPILLMRARKLFLPYLAACVWTSVVYLTVRASGLWDASGLIEFARESFSEERAGSLVFRLEAENALIGRGLERPVFGWTPWQFKLVTEDDGRAKSVITDSRWIIAFLTNGMVGLASLTFAYVRPVLASIRRVARADAASAMFPFVLAVSLIVTVAWLDLLFNAFESPIVIMSIGALTTFSSKAMGSGRVMDSPPPNKEQRPAIISARRAMAGSIAARGGAGIGARRPRYRSDDRSSPAVMTQPGSDHGRRGTGVRLPDAP